MVDPHSDAVHDLNVLIDVARQLGATFELLPLLRTIEQAGREALDCDRATVFLYDAGRDELYSKVATGTGEIRFSARLGIAGEAARTHSVILVPDAYQDPRFNPEIDRKTGYRTRNMLTVPLVAPDGEVMGVLQVLNKKSGEFHRNDEMVAAALGSLTGIAIKRQMLLDAAAEKMRLEKELDIARQIQQELLPKTAPSVPGFDIAGWNRPADSTGGDFYDYFPLGDGRWALTIADATGHGIGPAIIMAQCRALLRAVSESCDDLSRIAARVNNLLQQDLPADRFVTVFHGILDPGPCRLVYVSAGHGPLLHYRRTTGTVAKFNATTLPMGILPDADMPCAEPVVFEPGDIFVLLTDGLLEWARSDGEQYGEDRIAEIIARHHAEPAARLIEIVYQEVLRFGGGGPQMDDLTMVVVKRVQE
ncbi:MAG: SpoIIE family protein phosphatase [Phycisphaerae bacterium]